jgi:hypothetical protein
LGGLVGVPGLGLVCSCGYPLGWYFVWLALGFGRGVGYIFCGDLDLVFVGSVVDPGVVVYRLCACYVLGFLGGDVFCGVYSGLVELNPQCCNLFVVVGCMSFACCFLARSGDVGVVLCLFLSIPLGYGSVLVNISDAVNLFHIPLVGRFESVVVPVCRPLPVIFHIVVYVPWVC